MLGPIRAGVTSLPQRLIANMRAELRRNVMRGMRDAKRKRERRALTAPVLVGETLVERCLREAREVVDVNVGAAKHRRTPYGSNNHSLRRKYDHTVQTEFHRRLAAVGIPVEGT